MASRRPHGYGQFGIRAGKVDLAHRVAYRLYKGEIHEGQCVRHKCDNPSCVNPDHLEIGTQADNMKDMVERRRQSKGEAHAIKFRGSRHGRAKLTDDDVRKIRMDSRKNVQIAADYGMAAWTIGAIKRGKAWKHIAP